MSAEHPPLAELLRARATHPHLAGCAQCRILLQSYDGFLDEQTVDSDAEARLRAAIDARVMARPSPRARLRPPRIGLGAGVIAAAAMLVFVFLRPQEPEPVRLRQGDPQATAAIAVQMTARADGSIELQWTAHPAADSYLLRIYGPDLKRIVRRTLPDATPLRLDRSTPELAAAPESLLVELIALREEVELGRSGLSSIVLER